MKCSQCKSKAGKWVCCEKCFNEAYQCGREDERIAIIKKVEKLTEPKKHYEDDLIDIDDALKILGKAGRENEDKQKVWVTPRKSHRVAASPEKDEVKEYLW